MVNCLLLLPVLIGSQAAPCLSSQCKEKSRGSLVQQNTADGFVCRLNSNWCIEETVAGMTTLKLDWLKFIDNFICTFVPSICDDVDEKEETTTVPATTVAPTTTASPTLPRATKKPRVKPYVPPSGNQKKPTGSDKYQHFATYF